MNRRRFLSRGLLRRQQLSGLNRLFTQKQYVHPLSWKPGVSHGVLDVGAYEK